MKKFKFGIALLFFIISLTIIIPVQTYQLWKLTLGVTELGHYFAVVPAVLLIFTTFKKTTGKIIFFLSAISLALFLYPIGNAILIAYNIRYSLIKAYGNLNESIQPNPFSFISLYAHQEIPIEKVTTMTFKSHGDINLTLDLYSPNIKQYKYPIIISVHGGAWYSGDNKSFISFNNYMASNGFFVAEINYRLAPENKFPAAIEDTKDAIGYLSKHSDSLSIDTNRIFLLGRSAGGQIALIAASDLKYPKIKGVIAFYTPSDMVWGYSMPGNPLILDSRKVLSDYLGGTYEQAKYNFHKASPLENVSKDFPPVLFIHGKRDEMVAYEHNLHIIPVLNKNYVPNYLLTLPWATHGCDYFINGPSGQLSTFAIDFFIHSQPKKH